MSTYLREMFRGADARPQRYVLDDDELARIRPPVAVLCGEHDGTAETRAQAAKRTALIPHARFEILAGGHEPWPQDPEACAAQISRGL